MRISTSVRATAVLVVASLFVVGAGTIAAAHTDPDDGSRVTDRRTHTGPDGATSDETISCTDRYGNVYGTANASGKSESSTTSGVDAACNSSDIGSTRQAPPPRTPRRAGSPPTGSAAQTE